MTKKNKHNKNAFRKYSSVRDLEYHVKREVSPGRFGLQFGGKEHSYSLGFSEAFTGRNNEGSVKREFGKVSSDAYATGFKRGRKTALKYFHKTGKQPSDFAREIKEKHY